MRTGSCISLVTLIFIFTFSTHSVFGVTISVPFDQPTIQDGINAAVDDDLVLVDPGTYVENIDFLGKAIAVAGSGGPDVTVIDGGQVGSCVTFKNGESTTSIIEGFTIRNGSGTTVFFNTHGGGIYCIVSSPYILNCSITGNNADFGGGVEFKYSPTPVLDQCTIEDNSAYSQGGAVSSISSAVSIWYSAISGNVSDGDGGGIYSDNSYVDVYCCTVVGNDADSAGGAIILYSSSEYSVIENSMISGNRAVDGGGIDCHTTAPTITNCTITGNRAAGEGGGVRFTSGSLPTVMNSLLWGDSASTGPEIWIGTTATPSTLSVSYSDVQGGQEGAYVEAGCTLDWLAGNMDDDPLFVDPGYWDDSGTPGDPSDDIWVDGDHHLSSGSPCIDTGTEAASITEDIDEDPRPLLNGYDMGADEYDGLCWDDDGDGYTDEVCGGDDCDDSDPDLNPGEEEICDNGIDDDCDGYIDSTDPPCVIIEVPGDQPTVQAAIDAAEDENTILVAPGTYVETINFNGKDITVVSEGGAGVTTLDGGLAGSVVTFIGGESAAAILEGFTITNGSGKVFGPDSYGGGLSCSYASPTIRNCIITGNSADYSGGLDIFQSSPMVVNCMITDNQAVNNGGGILCEGSSPDITNCTISGNSADSGGGIYCEDSSSPTIINVISGGTLPLRGRRYGSVRWEILRLSQWATATSREVKGRRM